LKPQYKKERWGEREDRREGERAEGRKERRYFHIVK
jgi:hypothetical protein